LDACTRIRHFVRQTGMRLQSAGVLESPVPHDSVPAESVVSGLFDSFYLAPGFADVVNVRFWQSSLKMALKVLHS